MLSEASGQSVRTDRAFKEAWAQRLTAAWPGIAAAQQAQWAESPMLWASLRVIWDRASEGERQTYRRSWAQALPGAIHVVKEQAEAEGAWRDLARLLEVRKARPLQAVEMRHAADDLQRLARIAREQGSEEGKQQADRLESVARELRVASAPPPAQAQATHAGAEATRRTMASNRAAEIMQRSTQQHSTFMQVMNMSMQSHYSRVNSINIMGGNPYRYVNAYGHPY